MENSKNDASVNPLDGLSPIDLCRCGLKVIAQEAVLHGDVAAISMCANVARRIGRLPPSKIADVTLGAVLSAAEALGDTVLSEDRIASAVRRCIYGSFEIGKVEAFEAASAIGGAQ